jgi:uncharacterized membrane protein YdjX (TVP38/TMEM64 family)
VEADGPHHGHTNLTAHIQQTAGIVQKLLLDADDVAVGVVDDALVVHRATVAKDIIAHRFQVVDLAVNLIGTVIMTTVPFFIGKRSGCKIIDRLIKKKPKLSFIREMTYNREFFLAFFIRIIGLLPADMVGMYLGASGMRYNRYILGTLLGLAPAVISFSVIGMSIDDPRSTLFIAAVCFELGLAVLSLVLFIIIRKRRQKKQTM